jgi:hypothetical protein
VSASRRPFDLGKVAARGFTIGPIESRVQPGRGYGSERFAETLDEVARSHGNFVSLTVFGRVWNLESRAVEPSFEAPLEETKAAVCRSVAQAHERGLSVFLVPHLWVETGGWRAELDPGSGERFEAWVKSYERFVNIWGEVAERCGVDLLAAGVELRFWVTDGARAESFRRVLRSLRSHYRGPVTYAANWDDVNDTLVLADLDVIGLNAFYPLHWEKNATEAQLFAGGQRAAEQVELLEKRFEKPVIFTEFGYTARKDTAIEPWLWPEQLGGVKLDQDAQETAYAALLAPMLESPALSGTFVWRIYADIADLSQEPDWGFSPWGKKSILVLKDAYESVFRSERRSRLSERVRAP